MNTVDALKKLYKTLAGKDYAGDPNPTDAEMIDAIAADASGSGGGGGVRTIDLYALPSTTNGVWQYHPGLSLDDFIGCIIVTKTYSSTKEDARAFIQINDGNDANYPEINLTTNKAGGFVPATGQSWGITRYIYNAETGEIRI